MIGLLKKAIVDLPIKTHFREFVESFGGPEQGYRRCLADVTNRSEITSALQAIDQGG